MEDGKNVRQYCKVDLLDIGSENFFETLIADEVKLCEMFSVILYDQMKDKGIEEKDFYKGFEGEAIEVATDAFLEGLVNFFHGGKKETVAKILAKSNQIMEATDEQQHKRIEAINPSEVLAKIIASGESTTSS